MKPQKKVVLVMGACVLDRSIPLQTFPSPDSKIRSSAPIYENLGGNAANTAVVIGLLKGVCRDSNLLVKLVTKIGQDSTGARLVSELHRSGVVTSDSRIFRQGLNETSAVTHILVSQDDHTRTCIFTPGSCRELSPSDFCGINFDEIFADVVVFHSDTRHTSAALVLAREAIKRGITVTVDVERDRLSDDFDKLLEIADCIFTNQDLCGAYVNRKYRGKGGLDKVVQVNINEYIEGDKKIHVTNEDRSIIKSAGRLLYHFTRRSSNKTLIGTRGKEGAVYLSSCNNVPYDRVFKNCLLPSFKMTISPYSEVTDDDVVVKATIVKPIERNLHPLDTTGAGDIFIGAFILYHFVEGCSDEMSLQVATWVAGQSIQGIAKSRIPSVKDVLQFRDSM